uniref:Hydroxysteroid dehydrogenase-like protein 2 n=1 Tax=Ditylenchus dipsaci TaxID=166011 RepID=A0A915EVU3_9BILA
MFNTGKFKLKTVVISGASRGIGKEIALKLAKDGANIVICAKTTTAHAKLPGTIYTAAEEVEKVITYEQSVTEAVEAAVKKFGGIDILINNASAISLTGTMETPMKRYDLMNGVNARGTFMMSQKCIPYLKQAKNPHILNLSPPLVMESQWFAHHVEHNKEACRKPSIVADAAYAMLSKNSKQYTGNFAIDEDILKSEGVTDFDQYAVQPGAPLMPDFFLPGVDYNSLVKMDKDRSKSRKAMKSSELDSLMAQIMKGISPSNVKSISAVYEFALKDNLENIDLYIDLKNDNGSVQRGKYSPGSDVQFEMELGDFVDMFNGKFSPLKRSWLKS